MIDWVHQDCLQWGDYRRKIPKAWPSKSTIWRLWMEQGAGGDRFGSVTPTWDMPMNVLNIHRAYLVMPADLRDAMNACYVMKGEPAKRAKSIGISRAKMYQIRSHCHYFIAGQAIEQKNSGICQESA